MKRNPGPLKRLWQRLLQFFTPRVEDSVRLRLLGLASLGVAALGIGWVGGDARICLLAGGLGALGHWSSWRWRRRKSRILPLVIAAIVVGISLAMRSQMLGAIRGDWLPLGYFLLLVQAASSFDLRTRGGLYTGLALSGTTLFLASQHAFYPSFAVLVVGFLVLLLAFLALAFLEDGIQGAQVHWVHRRASMGAYWIGAACAVFVLSGVAFWLMPRGGDDVIGPSQIAILPYSSNSLEEISSVPTIDLADIPAVDAGDGALADMPPGAAGSPSGAAGTWAGAASGLAEKGLLDILQLGQLGTGRDASGALLGGGTGIALTGDAATGPAGHGGDGWPDLSEGAWGEPGHDADDDVVFFVRSRVISYWRGLTLDTFDGQQWGALVAGPFTDSEGFMPYYLERVRRTSNIWYDRESHRLDNGIVYYHTFVIQRDQPGLVFMGYRGLRIVADDGALEGFGVREGDSYRVVSAHPEYTLASLKQDHSAGAGSLFTSLPPGSERLRRLAAQITEDADSDFEKAERIIGYLAREGKFDPQRPGDLTSLASLEQFLFEGHTGSVLDYASATAVLARAAGLSARLALGYLPGTRDPLSGAYVVRDNDAHVWAEIFFANHGWVPFDPTPRASGVLQNGADTGMTRLLRAGPGEGVFQSAKAAPGQLADMIREGLEHPDLLRLNSILALVVVTTLLVFRWLYAHSKGRRQTEGSQRLSYTQLTGEGRQEVLKLYARVEKMIRPAVGDRRKPWQTVAEYAGAANNWSPEVQRHLRWFTQATWLAAYNPHKLPEGLAQEARSRLPMLKTALKANSRPAE